jgi:putative flippase GtrA
MTLLSRDRLLGGPRAHHRPAVVERVDSPQSTSGGRATTDPRPTLGLQIVRFAAIGVVSTIAWAGLYSLLRAAGLGSVVANGLALVVTTIGNTAANRRLTFGVTGRRGLVRDHGAGLLAFALAISLTTASATALDALAPHAGRLVELAVLSGANVVATGGRFLLLRTWLGRPPAAAAT